MVINQSVIEQGDIYWITRDEPDGSEPRYRRPYVVVQNNVFNQSRINTVVLCALTTNIRRAKAPGNVLLNKGEANLPQQSAVNISQVVTVDKQFLTEKIGALSMKRVEQIVAGLQLLIEPREY